MKMTPLFFSYLKNLFTTYIIYIGFIPEVYDAVSIFLDKDLPSLPPIASFGFLLFCFLWANFSIWKKQQKEIEELKNEQPNYKLDYRLKPIEKIDIKAIEEEIKKADEKVAEHAIDKAFTSFSMPSIPSIFPQNTPPTKGELITSLEEAKEYNEKVKGVFKLQFTIENIGTVFDEQINIEAKGINLNIVDEDLQETITREEFEPSSGLIPFAPPNKHKTPYYDVLERYTNGFEIELRELKVDDSAIINCDPFLIKGEAFEFDFVIKSKKLRKSLCKQLLNKYF